MSLDIAQEQLGGLRLLGLRGRLDTETSADLELAVQDLLGAGAREFLIDLADVSYVSSAGLRVLLALAKQLEGSQGRLRLCGLNASVAQVFEVAGFSRLFAISPDRASALASMAKTPAAAKPPTLAQHAARILGVPELALPRGAEAADLARDVAQLLGVKPIPMGAASTSSSAPAAALPPADGAKRSGVVGKLRGLFGAKR